MTQYFTYRGFSLRKAPLQIRALVTCFLVVASLGLAVGAVNYQVRTGLAARGSPAWYRGTARTGADAPAGAPFAQRAAEGPLYEKSPLELLDATHPHLFNQAFLFFVLGHLLALCAVAPRLKIGLYLAGFTGVLLDTASPWLIRYLTPGAAWLQLGGHLAMAVAFVGLVGIPLWEMWVRAPDRGEEG